MVDSRETLWEFDKGLMYKPLYHVTRDNIRYQATFTVLELESAILSSKYAAFVVFVV
jgi:hypothetical protein